MHELEVGGEMVGMRMLLVSLVWIRREGSLISFLFDPSVGNSWTKAEALQQQCWA
jgi:hypothetical protein